MGHSNYRVNIIESRESEVEKLQNEIASFVNSLNSKTLVVSNKKVKEVLKPRFNEDVSTIHFGNLRGQDIYKDHDNIVVIGREQAPPQAYEGVTRAYFYDEDIRVTSQNLSKLSAYINVAGCKYKVKQGVPYFLDDNKNRFLYQGRERESEQAIDRLRLIHNANPKNVYILSNISLNLEVNYIYSWNELLAGGSKLDNPTGKRS